MKKFNKFTVILFALMLTCVIAITASFSWLNRPNGQTDPADAMNLTATAVVKEAYDADSKPVCSITNYRCVLENGILTDNTLVADGYEITAGKTQYFKTVITNNGTSKNNVSLTNLTLDGIGGSFTATVNNFSPLKTSQNCSGESATLNVAEHLTIDAGESLTVEWYICNSGTSGLKVTKLPIISFYS